ncbi:MAG: enoyl-CoA hydratase-related protein [Gemmatales bacterium]
MPEAASSWFLPRIVGISTALEWTMAARMVSAKDALAAGLVRSLHAPDALLDAALKLGEELATSGSRVAVSLTRQMMWRMLGAAHPMEAHRVDSRAILARRSAPDTLEGVQAFLDKRPAIYTERVLGRPARHLARPDRPDIQLTGASWTSTIPTSSGTGWRGSTPSWTPMSGRTRVTITNSSARTAGAARRS